MVSTYFILTLGLQFVHIEILKSINHGPLVSHREEAAIFFLFCLVLQLYGACQHCPNIPCH